jgi:hypothetical protein
MGEEFWSKLAIERFDEIQDLLKQKELLKDFIIGEGLADKAIQFLRKFNRTL